MHKVSGTRIFIHNSRYYSVLNEERFTPAAVSAMHRLEMWATSTHLSVGDDERKPVERHKQPTRFASWEMSWMHAAASQANVKSCVGFDALGESRHSFTLNALWQAP